jgi:ubiquitin carboxyl-terminal hydrolase 16/45
MMKPGQNQVLYALYGVVEHSGTLHGGHYIAYVKVSLVPEINAYKVADLGSE